MALALCVERFEVRDPTPKVVDAQMQRCGFETIDLCGGCGECGLRQPRPVLPMRLGRSQVRFRVRQGRGGRALATLLVVTDALQPQGRRFKVQ